MKVENHNSFKFVVHSISCHFHLISFYEYPLSLLVLLLLSFLGDNGVVDIFDVTLLAPAVLDIY